MKTMADFPYPPLPSGKSFSDATEFVLDEDYLLEDDFSDKESRVANKGDTVSLRHYPNFGTVKHPVHGTFRY